MTRNKNTEHNRCTFIGEHESIVEYSRTNNSRKISIKIKSIIPTFECVIYASN